MSGTFPPYPDLKKRRRFPWYNTPWFGMIIGALAPVIVFIAIKETNYRQLDLKRFLENAIAYELMATFLIHSLMINLAIFFCVLMMELDNTARGVVAITLFWLVAVIYFKFF